jgi:tetratricopeptide (TPR) repeat protein
MEWRPATPRISELGGQRLAAYEIMEMIGRGGMAVVYRALQPSLNRFVAIKVLPPYLLHEEEFLAHFQQEAETVAHLDHPNILPIYDFGREGDVPYFVMPLVTGGTLREWLSEPPPLERALGVFGRVLEALEYAHRQGVIHRDIKPSNILMSQGDWPLLADFGIAKVVERSMRAKQEAEFAGTPEYMAPEQSQGVVVDPRTDLYAMGIILFEMLTGRLPFEAATAVGVIYQHVHAPIPSPRDFSPALPPVWDEVIRRSLAKDPADRFASARVMAEAVQAAWSQARREHVAVPTEPGADAQLTARYARGEAAFARHDWVEAIAAFEQVLAQDPDHRQAGARLSEAQHALDVDRALACAQDALAVGHLPKAISQLEALVQRAPESEAARVALAQARAQMAAIAAATQPSASPPPAITLPIPPRRPAGNEPASPPVVAPTQKSGRRATLLLVGGLVVLALVTATSLWQIICRRGGCEPPAPDPISSADLLAVCNWRARDWVEAVAACERLEKTNPVYPAYGRRRVLPI